ncbi:MAG: Fe-S cluster assembly ATPase SufC [Candidatus Peregrinibacteria bacterium]|nr:Fe-S cluster assembly ATPase SufC [Candidatus Peregrinibacteria bacterium]
MLKIKGLKVRIEDNEILHGIDLEVNPGEIHAIMGPNGSGKSTLSAALMGHPKYEITEGSVMFRGQDLLAMDPEDRAALGLFLSFQYPKEIPGVNLVSFMRASYNAVRKAQAEAAGKTFESISLFKFKKVVMDKMSLIGMPASFMNRATNEGFSGGEKKKCEILQMAVLEPKLAVLDETDSGLDIDALRDICKTIREVRTEDQSLLMITHYQRILDYITPDVIHIMMDGKVVMSGGPDLAKTLEKHGYDYVREKVGLKKPSSFKMVN